MTITGPVDHATFTEGDTVSFAGTATDAEDGDADRQPGVGLKC